MFRKFLSRFRAVPSVIRATPMSDADLVAALAVDAGHPLLQAFLELIDRARTEARMEAKAGIKSDREMLFSLGSEHGLDQLEQYLLALRAEGERQRSASI